MADRVVLHVGAMKSGTSYVQSRLFASKEPLAAQGVCVPGATWNDQVGGVLDVLGRRRPDGRHPTGAWAALLEEAAAWDGTAVVSMEFLGPVGPDKVAAVVASLAPARVTVVLTVRDLNRSLAAMWQETVQNGRWWTWPDYLAGAERGRPRPGRTAEDVDEAGRTFWRQQNAVRLARHWSQAPGVDRLALVTVPPPGAPADVLGERFAAVAGFDPASLLPGPRANSSVDAAAAEVLRRTNELLAEEGLVFPRGAVLRKRHLAKTVLAARERRDLRIGLPVAPWVVEHAAGAVAALQRLDVDLVGAWSDLDPVEVPGIDPTTVSAADVAEAAEQALAGLEPLLAARLGDRWQGTGAGSAAPAHGDDPVAPLVGRLAAGIAAAVRAEEV